MRKGKRFTTVVKELTAVEQNNDGISDKTRYFVMKPWTIFWNLQNMEIGDPVTENESLQPFQILD